jgi:cytochrome c-type biogenesis protein CcmH
MNMRAFALAAIFAAHLFAASSSWSMDAEPAFDDPVQQERYQRLTQQFRCPKCRNETIADSSIPVAADLRRQVKELMEAGKTDEEIHRYIADRYGDYLLYSPPVTPRTWILWAAPILLLGGGIVAACVVIARKSRLPDTDPADPGLGAS